MIIMSESDKSKEVVQHGSKPHKGVQFPNETALGNERTNIEKVDLIIRARAVPIPPPPEKPKDGK
jgi:hypothetical protein